MHEHYANLKQASLKAVFLSHTLQHIDIRHTTTISTTTTDITITYIHTRKNAAKSCIQVQLYLQQIHIWIKNYMLNPDKTACTLFTSDPAEYNTKLHLQIDHTTLHMNVHPDILGVTLYPKLTCNTDIVNIATNAHKS